MRLPLAGIACLVAAMAAASGRRRGAPVSPPALRIDGAGPGAHAGASVAGAGDVNGDGHAGHRDRQPARAHRTQRGAPAPRRCCSGRSRRGRST